MAGSHVGDGYFMFYGSDGGNDESVWQVNSPPSPGPGGNANVGLAYTRQGPPGWTASQTLYLEQFQNTLAPPHSGFTYQQAEIEFYMWAATYINRQNTFDFWIAVSSGGDVPAGVIQFMTPDQIASAAPSTFVEGIYFHNFSVPTQATAITCTLGTAQIAPGYPAVTIPDGTEFRVAMNISNLDPDYAAQIYISNVSADLYGFVDIEGGGSGDGSGDGSGAAPTAPPQATSAARRHQQWRVAPTTCERRRRLFWPGWSWPRTLRQAGF